MSVRVEPGNDEVAAVISLRRVPPCRYDRDGRNKSGHDNCQRASLPYPTRGGGGNLGSAKRPGRDKAKRATNLGSESRASRRSIRENAMRFAVLRATVVVAAMLTLPIAAPAFGQSPASPPNASTQGTTQSTPQSAPAQSGDAFGEDAALAAKTIVYVKGSGTWDKAFDIISGSFKKIKTYLDKEGIKPDGLAMTIFTATDDTGFEYEAAVPIAETPKNPPHGDIAVGQSPEGKALKFVHRGSYDDLDNTYEAITNYLDDKRLEAKDMFIEEYVTDLATSDAKKLVVNVYVLIRPGQGSPG
jgi:effector-binding domain-containing protein